MCGIAGISFKDQQKIEKATEKIAYRGPDDRGVFVDENVSLGHRRLSIIDLSENAHQPMAKENTVITYNGEIYNFKELGYESRSDTEVILRGFKEHGTSFFSKLRGMWAFAIYDNDKIILSRDYFGIKPLFYSIKNNQLYFASELKALVSLLDEVEPNSEHSYQFFNLGYFIAPNTCYKGIKKVMPGGILTWDIKKKEMSREKIKINESNNYSNFDNTVDLVDKILQDSVKAHFVSDVPVGLLLSGGNDSSLMAALSVSVGKKPTAYNLDISGSQDNEYAKKVSNHLGLKLKSIKMTDELMEKQYEKIWEFIDEPTGDTSIIPTSLIYSLIKGESKVVLSGEGGDELFGGYLRHETLAKFNKVSLSNASFPYGVSKFSIKFINPILSKIRNLVFRNNLINSYLRSVKIIDFPIKNTKVTKDLYKFYLNNGLKSSANLFFDRFIYLPDNLMSKTDISSMSSSIEARVPFLDKNVFSTILKQVNPKYCLSTEYKGKIILKKIMEKYLPSELIYRPKKGFSFSFNKYSANKFREDAKKAIIFHRENAHKFGLSEEKITKLIIPENTELLIKKYPRFVFALVTNWKIFKQVV